MVRLKCPNCANLIDAAPGTSPSCPACGFTGTTPRAATAPAFQPAFTPVQPAFSPLPATDPGARPGWVVMVAVFQFIGGAFGLLFGLILATVGGSLVSQIDHPVADVLGSIAAVLGIVFLLWGAFEIVLGTQNLRGREWARVLSIVLASIAAAFELFTLVFGNFFALFSLTIYTLIIVGLSVQPTRAWYQARSSRVRAVAVPA